MLRAVVLASVLIFPAFAAVAQTDRVHLGAIEEIAADVYLVVSNEGTARRIRNEAIGVACGFSDAVAVSRERATPLMREAIAEHISKHPRMTELRPDQLISVSRVVTLSMVAGSKAAEDTANLLKTMTGSGFAQSCEAVLRVLRR